MQGLRDVTKVLFDRRVQGLRDVTNCLFDLYRTTLRLAGVVCRASGDVGHT